MTLTQTQLQKLRSSLEEELTELRDMMDDRFGMGESQETMTDELSFYDNHPADLGSETFERGKDLALREHHSIRLNEVDAAIERMEDGTYGTCVHCNQEIPFARLEVEPAAEFCVDCQEQADAREVQANRPVEENFLFPGFGRSDMDENDEDYNGFDGEDAWQAVARYGTASGNDDNPFFMGNETNHMYIEADERIGYVEDLEGFLIADINGNPIEPGFIRNEPYRRAFEEAGDGGEMY
ncbi:TraR/DksA C4-type zinc finger protein [Tumebacillus permanentifrigoris]|uniref:TraR/DksA family transcriptional regulator n=1 Tax=Tumebacillus permanentifrigoris TaxID=378543 RepID=A0A316D803_9BACL|nr:TraR/DksA C4-type zinc finger protein [Tumebacillus permanentifrigoris]PWK12869.1 TraR/DksA family transcriptional regulator [Tumebacillus permanentifrigoris]